MVRKLHILQNLRGHKHETNTFTNLIQLRNLPWEYFRTYNVLKRFIYIVIAITYIKNSNFFYLAKLGR